MKISCRSKAAALTVLLPMLTLLSGCVHQQFVSEPYPRWGKEYRIDRSEDDPPLLLRVMTPPEDVQPAACVLLIHGMNEYIGRYSDVAHYFSRQFIVTGFDYYAHGLSNTVLWQADKALRSDADKPDVSQAYQAQKTLYDLEPIRKDFGLALKKTIQICDTPDAPQRPVFIVAHSLGALIAASYLLQAQNDDLSKSVHGVVFLGPGFAVSELPGWRGWLANPLIRLSFHAKTHFLNPHDESLPALLLNQIVSLVTVPLLDGLFEVFSWPGLRQFATPTTPGWVLDYMTDSEIEKDRLQADGWIIRRTMLRYLKGIESEIVQFRNHMDSFSMPYYLIYSAHDPITSAWGNEDFLNKTLKNHPHNAQLLLPDLQYHQHLFLSDPLKNDILQQIEMWLENRIQNVHTTKQHHDKKIFDRLRMIAQKKKI